jgi:uncharacterized protein YcnI
VLLLKIARVLLPTFLGLVLFGSVASAHVEVTPNTSLTGEEEVYTVRVPNEKKIPTVKLTIKIPSGLEFDSVEPLAGWKFTTQEANGKVKSITFETTGEGILPGQFQRFAFIAANPDKPTKAAWDAYQFYKDGSVVEWTGDEGSESPHSITDIVSETKVEQPAKQTKDSSPNPASTRTSSIPLTISIISGLLSIVAIFLGIRKK